MADTYTMGVDIGSAASKCIILKNGTQIVGKAVIPSGTGTSGPSRAIRAALESASLSKEQISYLTATGYGRNTLEGADLRISELSCHAAGTHALFPDARTVIDIGGQDVKILSLNEDGTLDSFVMNDKCAAGTGRFLEAMARVLETDVQSLADLDSKALNVAKIASTCTVFAESEVISQLSNNVSIYDLAAGIHASVAARTASLVRRLGFREPGVMTGGVAQNAGVRRALEKELGTVLLVSPMAQLNGAYGAALLAWKHFSKTGDGTSD
ncbi:MAG: 2-hydroxyglutaryl-CoA dehydratase [Clostridiales bacterium]|nr:2-hydroxyglutaryl-CoA dehydratase [Clostridiales bacterium]